MSDNKNRRKKDGQVNSKVTVCACIDMEIMHKDFEITILKDLKVSENSKNFRTKRSRSGHFLKKIFSKIKSIIEWKYPHQVSMTLRK